MALIEVFNGSPQALLFQERLRNESLGSQIEIHRFDVIGVYGPLLDLLDKGITIEEAYDKWEPDPYWDTLRNGGSDCFGLAAVLQKDYAAIGIQTNILPFNTKGLAPEAVEITGDVGHVALFTEDAEGITIFDPGFALGKPLHIRCGQPEVVYNSGDGRKYHLRVDFEKRTGEITIESDYHPQKNFGFRLESVDPAQLGKFQKQFMRIRETVNCDKFDNEGMKDIGLKIKLMEEALVVWRDGKKEKVTFREWEWYTYKENVANSLGYNPRKLDDQVRRVIRRAPQLRELWPASMKREYQTGKRNQIHWHTQGYRSWSELKQQGYKGGGVMAFIKNSQGQLLMYQVPKSREKPHIGRFAGQLNVMTETANGDEEGLQNLARGIGEELNVDPHEFTLDNAYIEASYGNDGAAIARCYVLQCQDSHIGKLSFRNQMEGGTWRWVRPDIALGYELEPNLRPILARLVDENLI